MRSLKLLMVLMACAAITAAAAAGNPSDEMFQAYSGQNFSIAKKLALKQSNTPEGKLILALCLIHDRESQDIPQGFKKLGELYRDSNLSEWLKIEVALSYARVAQLMQDRKDIYGNAADGVKFSDIYNEILKTSPDSTEACYAIVYKNAPLIESSDDAVSAKAFQDVEKFIKSFKGDPKLLSPVHLFAEYEYIAVKKDYRLALEHLEAAVKLGIANPTMEQDNMFRIGRIYQIKLGDKQKAIEAYNKFLGKFPSSNRVPIVERYLEELGAKKQGTY